MTPAGNTWTKLNPASLDSITIYRGWKLSFFHSPPFFVITWWSAFIDQSNGTVFFSRSGLKRCGRWRPTPLWIPRNYKDQLLLLRWGYVKAIPRRIVCPGSNFPGCRLSSSPRLSRGCLSPRRIRWAYGEESGIELYERERGRKVSYGVTLLESFLFPTPGWYRSSSIAN